MMKATHPAKPTMTPGFHAGPMAHETIASTPKNGAAAFTNRMRLSISP